MRVACISDLHGKLPEISPCDLLLIAGDVCPHFSRPVGGAADMYGQAKWLGTVFKEWLDEVPSAHVVAVAGNHDFVFERRPELVPALRWRYLLRESVEIGGLKIWGTPDQLPFCDWAFNVPEEELRARYAQIPLETDIILTHGPPYGLGDLVPERNACFNRDRHTGSPSLTAWIETHQPQLVVTGHIHDAYGTYSCGKTKIINASVLDEDYRLVNTPAYVDLDPPNA